MQSLSLQTNQALTAQQMSICDAIADGLSFKAAALDHGISTTALQRMRVRLPAFANAVAIARAAYIDARVDSMDEIVAATPDIQRARLICDNIKWAASKLAPTVYGDRLDVNVEHRVDLGTALAMAKARALRPRRDPDNTIDVEYEALPRLTAHGTVDHESIAPPRDDDPSALPDIFA